MPLKIKNNTLSVCMIVKDEEENIKNILGDLQPLGAEIIVVDTGSTDKTRDVASSMGANFFNFTWCDDFSKARNYSLSRSTGDFILWVDADDRINPECIKELKQNLNMLQKHIHTVCINSNGFQFMQKRIFPNCKSIRFEGAIHETINENSYEVYPINSDKFFIDHTGYDTKEKVDKKIIRNIEMLEKIKNKTEMQLFSLACAYSFESNHDKCIPILVDLKNNSNNEHIKLESIIMIVSSPELNDITKLIIIDEGLKIEKNDIRLNYLKGSIFLNMGKVDAAYKCFTEALACPKIISNFPMNYDMLHHMASVEEMKIRRMLNA